MFICFSDASKAFDWTSLKKLINRNVPLLFVILPHDWCNVQKLAVMCIIF